MATKTTQYSVEEVRKFLQQDEALRKQAVLYLWKKKQTGEERSHGRSYVRNGAGFDKWDSQRLSSIASKVDRGWELSSYESDYLEHRLPRYCRQLQGMVNNLGYTQAVPEEKKPVRTMIERPEQLRLI